MRCRWLIAMICLGSLVAAACSGPEQVVEAQVPTPEVSPMPAAIETPTLEGEPVVGETLRVVGGSWEPADVNYAYQWSRGGEPVEGAVKSEYLVSPDDIDQLLAVEVTVSKAGHREASLVIGTPGPILDPDPLPPVVRTVRYTVEVRGQVPIGIEEFTEDLGVILTDRRGWRRTGAAFEIGEGPVDFTVILAQAELLPTFSSGCSVLYSCRVGELVIINATPWMNATPSWTGVDADLRSYREMVINHEVGHWLRVPHLPCPGPGATAPVMLQQSKSLDGCQPQSWPTDDEIGIALAGPRF